MKKAIFIWMFSLFLFSRTMAQGNPPWNNPLLIAYSDDGIQFTSSTMFQDSSGVPCVIRWHGDTLACVFQWFRQPMNSPTWDRVAIKFSYDDGLTWTTPTPIVINNFPITYQRPFDPTIVRIQDDSIRIYYSSSDGMSGGNASINTYSAKSKDGITYEFEPNARVDHSTNRVIDPAVIFFNNSWHYMAPIGAPQDGAYHYTSSDGLNFIAQSNIASDNQHNWTGNFVEVSTTELRFYGAGGQMWFNTSSNGTTWNGYTNTNITQGGDPSVAKRKNNKYLVIYVGPPTITGTGNTEPASSAFSIFPLPAAEKIFIKYKGTDNPTISLSLSNLNGKILLKTSFQKQIELPLQSYASGQYFINLSVKGKLYSQKIIHTK